MRRRSREAFPLFLCGALLLLCARDAHAYLDLGTGAYVLQILLAGLLASAFLVKVYWQRIWGFLTKPFSRKKGEEHDGK